MRKNKIQNAAAVCEERTSLDQGHSQFSIATSQKLAPEIPQETAVFGDNSHPLVRPFRIPLFAAAMADHHGNT